MWVKVQASWFSVRVRAERSGCGRPRFVRINITIAPRSLGLVGLCYLLMLEKVSFVLVYLGGTLLTTGHTGKAWLIQEGVKRRQNKTPCALYCLHIANIDLCAQPFPPNLNTPLTFEGS